MPSGLPADYREQRASVGVIQEELRRRLGLDLDRDGCVQDASFYDELFVLTPEEDENRKQTGAFHHYMEFAIRFSNFGGLFTVHSCIEPIPARYDVSAIRGIVEQHGWKYVPDDQLEVPYDGINETLKKAGITWWTRFFDYL